MLCRQEDRDSTLALGTTSAFSRSPYFALEDFAVLKEIKSELARLSAKEIRVSMDEEFEPETGELVKVELGGAYWHLMPVRFLELLKDLPNRAGSTAVHRAIEQKEAFVWHGPSPAGSRDTSG